MSGELVAVHVARAGGPLVPGVVASRPLMDGWARVAVAASGVCYADISTSAAMRPGTVFPVTPGHEVAGTITELGGDVSDWQVGHRVVVGWFGGSCGECEFCLVGDVVHCPDRKVPGISYPGGWAQSIDVPVDALAAIPDGMDFFDTAPMGCAGVTTFKAIRLANLPAGGTVAVFGVGGLGHLAVQFAARMGYRTIAIARGSDRSELAYQLGAHHYIDSTVSEAGSAIADLGGAGLILSTAPSTGSVSGLIAGLKARGRLTLIGIDGGTVAVPVAQLVMNSQVISGHLTGSPRDTEDAMQFAHANGVRPMIERMPLVEANQAVERIKAGKPRFRIVFDTGDTTAF